MLRACWSCLRRRWRGRRLLGAVYLAAVVGGGACTSRRTAQAAGESAPAAVVGTWVWRSHPRPPGARRSLTDLFWDAGQDGRARVRFDTLWLRADGRHVTRRALVEAVLDSAHRPGPTVPVPGIPVTTDSGSWRFVRAEPGGAGRSGTLCTTSRGATGPYCAPATLRGDTLAWGAVDDVRRFHRVAGRGGDAAGT
jgi:hypothetical protein